MQHERASKKQQELLSFVDGFIKTNGYGPSYREIMNGLGYKSVSTVAIHIENLIAKGYLMRRDKSARSLAVVTMQPSGSPAAAPSAQRQLSRDLEGYIAARQLSDEQREVVAQALTILELTAASESTDLGSASL